MPSKKRRAGKAPSTNKIRRDLRKLRDSGLISKRVDLRKKPTAAQKRLLKKYDDVLKGRAVAIDTGSAKKARAYKKGYTTKGNVVIVPRQKGERVRYNKKTNTLSSTRKVRGKTVTKTVVSGQLPPLGPNEFYVLPFAGGQRFRTNDLTLLLQFGGDYESRKVNPFKNWQSYVEIETVEDEGENVIPISSSRWYRRKRKRPAPRGMKPR